MLVTARQRLVDWSVLFHKFQAVAGYKGFGWTRHHALPFHGQQRWKQVQGWNWKSFIKGNVPAGCSQRRLCWHKRFQCTPSCTSITNVAPLISQGRGARVATCWPNQGILCVFFVHMFVCYILLHAGVQQQQVQTGAQGYGLQRWKTSRKLK